LVADLDTLLIALYVELTDRIIPSRQPRRGPGRRPVVTDAEVVCLAVAQVLLRYHDERHGLRAAAARVGHLFSRLLGSRTPKSTLTPDRPLPPRQPGSAARRLTGSRWLRPPPTPHPPQASLGIDHLADLPYVTEEIISL
jgi:hypothetical protein